MFIFLLSYLLPFRDFCKFSYWCLHLINYDPLWPQSLRVHFLLKFFFHLFDSVTWLVSSSVYPRLFMGHLNLYFTINHWKFWPLKSTLFYNVNQLLICPSSAFICHSFLLKKYLWTDTCLSILCLLSRRLTTSYQNKKRRFCLFYTLTDLRSPFLGIDSFALFRISHPYLPFSRSPNLVFSWWKRWHVPLFLFVCLFFSCFYQIVTSFKLPNQRD